MPRLTIAIPTYNRLTKLKTTITRFLDVISESGASSENVEIVVSNNASTDGTKDYLLGVKDANSNLIVYNQKTNIGLDGNMRFLYENAKGDYVWFFSDDDVLFEGGVQSVIDTLARYQPDAMLFSFVQPVGSRIRLFDYPEPVTKFEDPESMISLLAAFPKLSIYVLKKITIDEESWSKLNRFMGTNYYFIAIAYTILQKSVSARLCVISEPIAGCDEDFNKIRFSPETWGNGWVVLQHDYVKYNAPHLLKSHRKKAYYDLIQVLFAYKTGALLVDNAGAYDDFINKLDINFSWLLKRPRSLGQLCFLKLGIVPLWVKFFSRAN